MQWLAALTLAAGYGVYGIWTWGLPWAAVSAAKLVPVKWEQHLGEAMMTSLAPGAKPCWGEVAQRLERAIDGGTPYKFEVRCAAGEEVNAFAAPGGSIVVFEGIRSRMVRDELAAAVVAHEMQHVLKRHSMQAVFRGFALQALFALLLGDASSLAAQLAGGMTALHYQRGDEEEADRGAVELMRRAGFDPRAVAEMLEALREATKEGGAPPEWLSSHPDLDGRIAETRRLAAR